MTGQLQSQMLSYELQIVVPWLQAERYVEFDFVHLLIVHACTYILMCINWESMSEPHTTVFNWEFCLCMCMYSQHILNFFRPHACVNASSKNRSLDTLHQINLFPIEWALIYQQSTFGDDCIGYNLCIK